MLIEEFKVPRADPINQLGVETDVLRSNKPCIAQPHSVTKINSLLPESCSLTQEDLATLVLAR